MVSFIEESTKLHVLTTSENHLSKSLYNGLLTPEEFAPFPQLHITCLPELNQPKKPRNQTKKPSFFQFRKLVLSQRHRRIEIQIKLSKQKYIFIALERQIRQAYKQKSAEIRRKSIIDSRVYQLKLHHQYVAFVNGVWKMKNIHTGQESREPVNFFLLDEETISYSKFMSLQEQEYKKTYLEYLPPIQNRFALRDYQIENHLTDLEFRHELLFDEDLFIFPNLQSKDGIEKKREYFKYWNMIEIEIAQDNYFYRIPLLCHEIACIIKEILPGFYHESIDSLLDIKVIDSSIRNGQFNPQSVIFPLMDFLNSCCAPVRDAKIQNIINSMKKSNQNESSLESKMKTSVDCLKQTFSLLELMKLDCVNEELYENRSLMDEDTMRIEYEEFKSIADTNTNNWFIMNLDRNTNNNANGIDSLSEITLQGLIHLIVHSDRIAIAETLRFDETRIRNINATIKDMINLSSIMLHYTKHIPGSRSEINIRHVWFMIHNLQSPLDEIIEYLQNKSGGEFQTKDLIELKRTGKGMKANLIGLIEKSFDSNNAVWKIITTRIETIIIQGILKKIFKKDIALSIKLNELESEFEGLFVDIEKLFSIHFKTYSKAYQIYLSKFRK